MGYLYLASVGLLPRYASLWRCQQHLMRQQYLRLTRDSNHRRFE
jgi:hypothetical protein